MPEQQNIEWKESWRDEYLKWICAFCNTKGGILIIGKRDDGSIKGIENSKKLLTTIPDKIINALGITCEVNLKVEGELEYIEIVVEQSKLPTAFDGRYYVRVGSTTRLLTGTALANFMLKMSNMDWEEVAIPYATIDDIDIEAINVIGLFFIKVLYTLYDIYKINKRPTNPHETNKSNNTLCE